MVVRVPYGMIGLLIVALSIIFGYRVYSVDNSQDLVSLEVGPITPESCMIQEGESIVVKMNLWNGCDSPIYIKKLSASCGCMNFKLDGKEYSDGAILPVGAKASIPIDLNINTAGTSGIRRYRIAIQYDDVKRRSFDLTKHLEFQVLGHLRVEPPSVTVLDAEINRQEQFQLYLSDGQLGEGIEIRDVVVSCQQRISTSIQTDDQSPTGDGRIRRKIVNVNYMPHDDYEYREDFVELVPANAAFSPVHVPIVCYKRPLGYLVTPKRLYLNEEELPARRTVECQSYSDRTASIDVISKPKFITVEIEAREKSKSILHVLVDRPESEKLESEVNEFEVVLGDSEEKTRTFCLPVYICSPIRK